jgi:polar amino acid transport system substrate-binding protein
MSILRKILVALSLLLLVAVFGSGELLAAETIHVYTYHIHPPFVTGSGVGQTFELTSQLQTIAGDRFDFKVGEVPRSRLNMLLKNWVNGECISNSTAGCEDNWILLWVNQKWGFGADPQAFFNWVKISEDSNSIISLRKAKIAYESPASLVGFKFGGISGHKYVGIDDLVETGKITRIDGSNERDNILKLYKRRVDVLLLPTSTIRYFMHNDPLISSFTSDLYVAEKKHQEYSRNIMIPKNRTDLLGLIQSLDTSAYQ